jgi:hypothetical protein
VLPIDNTRVAKTVPKTIRLDIVYLAKGLYDFQFYRGKRMILALSTPSLALNTARMLQAVGIKITRREIDIDGNVRVTPTKDDPDI